MVMDEAQLQWWCTPRASSPSRANLRKEELRWTGFGRSCTAHVFHIIYGESPVGTTYGERTTEALYGLFHQGKYSDYGMFDHGGMVYCTGNILIDSTDSVSSEMI